MLPADSKYAGQRQAAFQIGPLSPSLFHPLRETPVRQGGPLRALGTQRWPCLSLRAARSRRSALPAQGFPHNRGEESGRTGAHDARYPALARKRSPGYVQRSHHRHRSVALAHPRPRSQRSKVDRGYRHHPGRCPPSGNRGRRRVCRSREAGRSVRGLLGRPGATLIPLNRSEVWRIDETPGQGHSSD
jgi:hypothetical protein